MQKIKVTIQDLRIGDVVMFGNWKKITNITVGTNSIWLEFDSSSSNFSLDETFDKANPERLTFISIQHITTADVERLKLESVNKNITCWSNAEYGNICCFEDDEQIQLLKRAGYSESFLFLSLCISFDPRRIVL